MPIELNKLSPEEREAVETVMAWGRQSIAFAISLRDAETIRKMGEEKHRLAAAAETQHLTNELFDEVQKKLGRSASMPEVLMEYTRSIFEWCFKHMRYAK